MSGSVTSDLDTAYAHCESLVRQADRDRFLANLFAPEEKRRHLNALHAFAIEISSVRDKVSDPLPGEIRLQWWMDAISFGESGQGDANPVLAALRDTMKRYELPGRTLFDMVDARVFDLYDDPMPTVHDLVGYAGETNGALMQLSAIILNDGEAPTTADIAGHGGVACTMTHVLCQLPKQASRGQVFIPLDILHRHGACRDEIVAGKASDGVRRAIKALETEARDHLNAMSAYVAQIPPKVAPAFLTCALARPYLDAASRRSDPLREPACLPQWRRQWVLWRASRSAARCPGC